ncbi:MAG: hypothetical protein KKC21_02955, partial [Nitrospinae bacterium]|nr:hypothetical protein [Nitrospinota bacterium]
MEKILSHLDKGVQIVTVNARLARLIRNGFDRRMVDTGKEGWATPPVVALKGWFQILWDDIWEDKKPYLTSLRSKVLWEKTIAEDNTLRNIPFLNITDMAEEAWKAYEIFRTYRLPLQEENIYSSRETLSFAGWLRGYRLSLESLGFIDIYDMRERVVEGIRVGEVDIPQEISLVGFQEVSPELVELIEAIKGRGRAISFLPSDPFSEDWKTFRVEGLSDKISVRRYADMPEEVSQCARWIRSIYASDKRIGLVVPDLNKYRDLIDKELAAELDPASAVSWLVTQGGYNISLGLRLSEVPIVRAGLEIISLGGGKVELKTIEYLIGSPYLRGAEAEFMERGRLVYKLREANYSSMSIAELSSFIVKNKLSLPMLASLLDSLKGAFKEWRKKKCPPSRWGELFASLLKDAGWGIGDDRFTLRSDEYQAVESWREALSGFTTLDEILG